MHNEDITPEMAQAGARVLADRYDLLGDRVDERIAIDVFSAMNAARSSSSRTIPRPEERAS